MKMTGVFVLEKLFDFIAETWELLAPFFVLDEYEAGIVLRVGKYNRRAKVGWNWKLPFFDTVLSETVVPTTMELRAQTLTDKDGNLIVISSIIKYEITDVKPFLLDIYDSVDLLSDVTLGAIKKVVSCSSYLEINLEKKVLRIVKREVGKYGVNILSIVFADQGKIKTIRLIQDALE